MSYMPNVSFWSCLPCDLFPPNISIPWADQVTAIVAKVKVISFQTMFSELSQIHCLFIHLYMIVQINGPVPRCKVTPPGSRSNLFP